MNREGVMDWVDGVRCGRSARTLLAVSLALAMIFLASFGQSRSAVAAAPSGAATTVAIAATVHGPVAAANATLAGAVVGQAEVRQADVASAQPIKKCMPGKSAPHPADATTPVAPVAVQPGSAQAVGSMAQLPAIAGAGPATDRTPPAHTHLDLGICRT